MPLTPEDLALRRNFIGASEAPAVAGEDPFRKPLDVYLSKKGLIETSTNDAMELGNVIERPILEWFGSKRGLDLVYPATTLHPEHAFMAATPDALVVGQDTSIQVKLVGAGMLRHWSDEESPPPWVIIQVQAEMEVVRVKRTIVLAVLGGTKPREYVVDRDPDFGAAIVELCRRFWVDFVEADVCPPVDESEAAKRYLESRYPRATRGYLPIPPAGLEELVSAYDAARSAEGEAKKAKELSGNRIRAVLGDAEGYASPFKWKVSWANTSGSPSWKDIAQELGATPELIAKHTSEGGRRIDVRIKKENGSS